MSDTQQLTEIFSQLNTLSTVAGELNGKFSSIAQTLRQIDRVVRGDNDGPGLVERLHTLESDFRNALDDLNKLALWKEEHAAELELMMAFFRELKNKEEADIEQQFKQESLNLQRQMAGDISEVKETNIQNIWYQRKGIKISIIVASTGIGLTILAGLIKWVLTGEFPL